MTASAPILRMANLRIATTGRHPKTLVDDVSLDLAPGEVLGLIGESGAGKTSVGLAALGHTRAGCEIAGGTIHLGDIELTGLAVDARRRLCGDRIAYVAQSAAASFNPAHSLMGQVCEVPLRQGSMTAAEAEKRAIALFGELDLPSPATFGARYPHQVSGGQLQRAMAAMAMICRPAVLILDEPTTALDVTTQIEVLASIRRLIRNHGTAALYISHDLAVVAQMADRIMIMRHGKTVEVGPARRILDAPQAEYTRRLVTTGARAAEAAGVAASPTGRSILKVEDVFASYNGTRVLDGVGLDIRRGQTCAIVGESGSGKTTLGRVVMGLKAAESGRVVFDGNAVGALETRAPDELARMQLVYQMPDVALNPKQTIATILGRPLEVYRGLRGAATQRAILKLLDMMELPADLVERTPQALSGGQKQRICIARALAAEPDLIVCDEITSALDPLVAEGILRLLKDIQQRTGVAYLFITHDLNVVRKVADHVVVMRQGQVVDTAAVDALFHPPHHPYTAALIAAMPQMRADWLDEAIRLSARAENT